MVEKVLDGRYRIIDNLSRGGFGQTYLAQDLKRPGNPVCVVKQLKPINPKDLDKAKELFSREAKALEKLGEHPQIPRLLAYFHEDNEFFLVQEYIEGQTLIEELQQFKTLPESQVIALVAELLSILQFVHRDRVIHRDITPKNIIRRKQDQKLFLIDFGAVKEITNLVQMGTRISSPGYSPIEQNEGRPSYHSDLYAVGIIAIEALTGINPNPNLPDGGFDTDPSGEITWSNSVQINRHFADFLDKMVRKNEHERYQTATEALHALESITHQHNNSIESANPIVANYENATTVATTDPPSSNATSLKKRKYWLWLGLALPIVFFSLTAIKVFSDRTSGNFKIPLNGKVVESTLDEEEICQDIISQKNLYCEKYTFSANSGQQATIEMNSDDFDPFLILQKPDGNRLAVNGDISAANWNAKIVTDLDKDGNYTIVARTTSTGEAGNYSIRAVVK